MKMNQWLGHRFFCIPVSSKELSCFMDDAERELSQQMDSFGIRLVSFDRQDYSFSAVVERDGICITVSIPDVIEMQDDWYMATQYRSTGRNRFCRWPDLGRCTDRLIRHTLKAGSYHSKINREVPYGKAYHSV